MQLMLAAIAANIDPPALVGWSGKPTTPITPAYLASGLFGVRVPANALARPGSCDGCASSMFDFAGPTVSALVGGYTYMESPGQAVDGQANRQIGASPAPYPFETDVLVRTPDGKHASFQASVQGPRMDADPSHVVPLSQSLNFFTGELSTRVLFGAKDGSWNVTLAVVQLISQTVPSLALQTITVESRFGSGGNGGSSALLPAITLRPRITAAGLPGTPYNSTAPGDIFHEGTPNMLLAVRSNSGSEVAMCVATLCSTGSSSGSRSRSGFASASGSGRGSGSGSTAAPPLGLLAPSCSTTASATDAEADDGATDDGPLTMTSIIGVASIASHPVPAAAALRQAHYGLYRGFAALRAENAAAWAGRWRGRVVAEGPGVRPADQAALDAAFFHLLSSAHASSRSGLSIDAYSCLEYGGRMFWDADLWMVPALALLDAPSAAAVTGFRGRTVEMARRNAGLYGFRGAMYPWETATSDGHDACVAPTGWSEQHISLDVALGALATARALYPAHPHSAEYTLRTAWPVVSGVAEWLLSRGTWTGAGTSPARFEVRHMGGPDESLGQVTNSNFFAVAGMMVLDGALELAATLPAGYVTESTLAEWRRTRAGMALAKTHAPDPDGGVVIKPFDEAPDDLAKATPENWSLGSLAYLFSLGLPVTDDPGPAATVAVAGGNNPATARSSTAGAPPPAPLPPLTMAEVNATLAAEEVLRRRFPASGSVPCSSKTEWFICAPYAAVAAHLGNRTESARVQRSFADSFHLPPFWTTTETAAVGAGAGGGRDFGHYGTNWGATLQAVTLGLSGLRLGALGTDPTSWGGPSSDASPAPGSRRASLPAGWESVSFGAWLGGKRYRVVARHGEVAQVTLMPM